MTWYVITVQIEILVGVECAMMLAFALSLFPFASIMMNIVQPLTHLINIAIYSVITFYNDDTGCQLSNTVQAWLIALSTTASMLPVVGLAARFVEVRVRACVHNRKMKRLAALAEADSTNDDLSVIEEHEDEDVIELPMKYEQLKVDLFEVENATPSSATSSSPSKKKKRRRRSRRRRKSSRFKKNTQSAIWAVDNADLLKKKGKQSQKLKDLLKIVNRILERRTVQAKVNYRTHFVECCVS